MDPNGGRMPMSFRLIAPKHRALCVAIAVVSGVPIGTACAADDLLGLYVGGAVGRSDMHLLNSWTGTFTDADEVVVHHTAWSASVGVRPLHLLGVELQYLDFGSVDWNRATQVGSVNLPTDNVATHTNAEALSAVLYAPIPVRFFDVYAKVGPAHWHSNVDINDHFYFLECPANSIARLIGCEPVALKEGGTNLAYGAGLQFKLGQAALRAEYERIEANPEYPYIYDLGFTWTF